MRRPLLLAVLLCGGACPALAQLTSATPPAMAPGPLTAAPLPEVPPGMEGRAVAVLQALDKISARVTVLNVPVDSRAAFGQLVVTPRACRVNPPSAAPESVAFLEIGEVDIDSLARSTSASLQVRPPKMVFSGWMFASTPALSALEHPIYDVILLRCEDRTPAPAETPPPARPGPETPAPGQTSDDPANAPQD